MTEDNEYSFEFNGSTATYHYSGTGEKDMTTIMGEFKFKCVITPIDSIKIDRLYRELIGNVNPHLASENAKNMAFALSQLKHRVVESPDFFKNKELNGGHLDPTVLVDIVNASIEAEAEFIKNQKEKLKELQSRLSGAVRGGTLKKEDEFEDPIDPEEIDIDE